MADPSEPQSPPLVTRAQAKAAGLFTYDPGRPCKYGHVANRYVVNSSCVRCVRENATIREQIISTALGGAKTFNAGPCRRCGGTLRYIKKGVCVACDKRRKPEEYKKHKARCDAQSKRWQQENPGRHSEIVKKHQRLYPDKHRAISRRRRALEAGCEGNHTQKDIDRIFAAQRGKCAYCRKPLRKRYHVDHITPIIKGGSDWPRNLQILHPKCNNQKHAKDPLDYAREIGLLI